MNYPNAAASDTSIIRAPKSLCVSRVPIFNHLPADELRSIAGKSKMRVFERGAFIHHAGDESNQLFIIHRGRVKVYRLSEGGKEQLVRILEPGAFTGELALFCDSRHDSYAEAMEQSAICVIGREDFNKLVLRYPAIGLHVMAELALRLGASENQTAVIATTPVNERIGLYLASLSEKANSLSITLPMSRKDLASYLGTTPETISRRFAEFEEAHWIAQSGQRKIDILDLDALLLL
ncbi:MAG: Crp/Fnr family transcriptional regulator [Simplicispira suum]|uniref:Crp/Fnr family transcriptional regulator n=1 Tax=Simplicispira suum TaxID=2109915 RepID=UPI001C6AA0E1|nr:Crp/Fnr family transcriptional regulator [Simplicispira suum]MBW7834810.1 Crp/Fnr family transcriptional regulator [Simplicispira suum]